MKDSPTSEENRLYEIDTKENNEVKGKRVWIVTFGQGWSQAIFSSFKKAEEFKYKKLKIDPTTVIGIGEWVIQ